MNDGVSTQSEIFVNKLEELNQIALNLENKEKELDLHIINISNKKIELNKKLLLLSQNNLENEENNNEDENSAIQQLVNEYIDDLKQQIENKNTELNLRNKNLTEKETNISDEFNFLTEEEKREFLNELSIFNKDFCENNNDNEFFEVDLKPLEDILGELIKQTKSEEEQEEAFKIKQETTIIADSLDVNNTGIQYTPSRSNIINNTHSASGSILDGIKTNRVFHLIKSKRLQDSLNSSLDISLDDIGGAHCCSKLRRNYEINITPSKKQPNNRAISVPTRHLNKAYRYLETIKENNNSQAPNYNNEADNQDNSQRIRAGSEIQKKLDKNLHLYQRQIKELEDRNKQKTQSINNNYKDFANNLTSTDQFYVKIKHNPNKEKQTRSTSNIETISIKQTHVNLSKTTAPHPKYNINPQKFIIKSNDVENVIDSRLATVSPVKISLRSKTFKA